MRCTQTRFLSRSSTLVVAIDKVHSHVHMYVLPAHSCRISFRIRAIDGHFALALCMTRPALTLGPMCTFPAMQKELQHYERVDVQSLKQPVEAVRLLERVLEIKCQMFGPKDPRVAATQYTLGAMYLDVGWPGAAETALRSSLDIMLGYAPDDVGIANLMTLLGDCAQRFGRIEEAEAFFRQAESIHTAKLGSGYEAATSLGRLASCIKEQGRLGEAGGLFRQALAMMKVHAPYDIQIPTWMLLLGDCAQHEERLTEAGELFMRALTIPTANQRPDYAAVAARLRSLALSLKWYGGRPGEAERRLRQALYMMMVHTPDDVEIPDVMESLGECALEDGRRKEAKELFKRARILEVAKPGPDDLLAVEGRNCPCWVSR